MNPHACWLVAARQSGRNFGDPPDLRYLLFFCLKSTARFGFSVGQFGLHSNSELGEGSIRNRRNRRNGETYGLVTPTQSVRISHTYNIL